MQRLVFVLSLAITASACAWAYPPSGPSTLREEARSPNAKTIHLLLADQWSTQVKISDWKEKGSSVVFRVKFHDTPYHGTITLDKNLMIAKKLKIARGQVLKISVEEPRSR